ILSSSLDLCWSPVMSTTFRFRLPPPPVSTLFPYTTLFRSCLFLTALMNASKLTLQGNEWVNHQRFHLTIEKLNTKQMKQLITFFALVAGALVPYSTQAQMDPLAGAWHSRQGDREQVVVFVDGYFSHSTFDVKNKQFFATRGGTYTANDGTLTVTWQYDTEKAAANVPADEWVGQPGTFRFKAANTLTINLSGSDV